MSGALNLTVRNPIAVMDLVVGFFVDTPGAELTLEGDVSAIDWNTVSGARVREDRGFVAVPFNRSTLEVLRDSVLPRVGLRSRVSHVVVRQGEERLFASYDNFGPGMVVVEAPNREQLCARLHAAGLLLKQRVVLDS